MHLSPLPWGCLVTPCCMKLQVLCSCVISLLHFQSDEVLLFLPRLFFKSMAACSYRYICTDLLALWQLLFVLLSLYVLNNQLGGRMMAFLGFLLCKKEPVHLLYRPYGSVSLPHCLQIHKQCWWGALLLALAAPQTFHFIFVSLLRFACAIARLQPF